MSKCKSKDKECLCKDCPLRFECFIQERIFSDALFQGLFEVLIAQGKDREEALEEVSQELKYKIKSSPIDKTYTYPNIQPSNTWYSSNNENTWDCVKDSANGKGWNYSK